MIVDLVFSGGSAPAVVTCWLSLTTSISLLWSGETVVHISVHLTYCMRRIQSWLPFSPLSKLCRTIWCWSLMYIVKTIPSRGMRVQFLLRGNHRCLNPAPSFHSHLLFYLSFLRRFLFFNILHDIPTILELFVKCSEVLLGFTFWFQRMVFNFLSPVCCCRGSACPCSDLEGLKLMWSASKPGRKQTETRGGV